MTNSQTAFEFLSGLKDSSIIQDDIIFGDGADATLMQFDNGSWIPRLKARVTELGKTLYGKGADYTFPLDLLLQQLEGLRQAQTQASNNINVPHNWPAQVMLDVGVPYYTILATYESFRVHNVFIDSTPYFQHFVWICELLDLWVKNALSSNDFSVHGSANNAATQLVRAINQDGLLDQIEVLKSTLEGMNRDEPNTVEQIYTRLSDIQGTLKNHFL
jgi:hypothetical protein